MQRKSIILAKNERRGGMKEELEVGDDPEGTTIDEAFKI
jgi:hypothetical protein